MKLENILKSTFPLLCMFFLASCGEPKADGTNPSHPNAEQKTEVCDAGFHHDEKGVCVADVTPPAAPCESGFHHDANGVCVADVIPPAPCESGFHHDANGVCVADLPPVVPCQLGFHHDAKGQCVDSLAVVNLEIDKLHPNFLGSALTKTVQELTSYNGTKKAVTILNQIRMHYNGGNRNRLNSNNQDHLDLIKNFDAVLADTTFMDLFRTQCLGTTTSTAPDAKACIISAEKLLNDHKILSL